MTHSLDSGIHWKHVVVKDHWGAQTAQCSSCSLTHSVILNNNKKTIDKSNDSNTAEIINLSPFKHRMKI